VGTIKDGEMEATARFQSESKALPDKRASLIVHVALLKRLNSQEAMVPSI
jgi:hypothetical protein